MSKSGVTNTLSESLMLEHRLGMVFATLDKLPADDHRGREVVEGELKAIKARLYKLPNYNASGLQKIMQFLKPYAAKEATV